MRRCALFRWKAKKGDATFRFHDPCFGPTAESLTLPPGVRAAAEALAGRRMTLAAALAALQAAAPGGTLEVPPGKRYVLLYLKDGRSATTHIHFLLRFR